ncbi:MAG: PEGA domain-containing protein [Bacteroidales bacterium]|nr:PEGA domain-containing protein [Bacteroidales bacterium]
MKNLFTILAVTTFIFVISSCSPTRYAAYKVETYPSGAQVFHDDTDLGKSPTSLWSKGRDGKGNISLSFVAKMNGYQDTWYTAKIYASAKSRKKAYLTPNLVTIKLEPCYYVAYKIITEPAGAHMSIKNGEYIGITPVAVETVSNCSGSEIVREFTIEKNGYKTINKRISLSPKFRSVEDALKSPQTFFVQLEPSSNTSKSVIKITSEPSGAAVYANENYWGQTPFEKEITWTETVDRFEIRAEKSGYEMNNRMITPKDKIIHIVLQPK